MESLPAAAGPGPKSGSETDPTAAGRHLKGRSKSGAPARDVQNGDRKAHVTDVTMEEAAGSAGSPPADPAAVVDDVPAAGVDDSSLDLDEEDEEIEAAATRRKRRCRSASASRLSEQTTDASTAAEAADDPAAADGAGTSAAAAGVGDTGLATNLNDPGCTPGTDEFAAAKSKVDEILAEYQQKVSFHARQDVSALVSKPQYPHP